MRRTLTDEEAHAVGCAIRGMLNLKKHRNAYGCKVFDTAWGTKTEQGLGHTLMRIIAEVQETGSFDLSQ